SKFNLAIQGKRQPGSSFKIFVLASALDDGIKPSKTYSATPFTMKLPGDDWKVVNASKNSSGRMNLRSATVFSVNAVYARLIQDIGPAKVVELAKKMGITTEIPPYPSIALGTVGVSPLEMASGASTLANMGVHNKPLGILKITDAKGRIVQENRVAGETVLDPEKAFQAVEILREVIARGTGKAANIGRPAFGKTGTTNSYRDAWFVGSTPDLAAAVWVGYPQAQIAMKSVRGIRVQGGTFPARIWSRFMGQAVADLPPSKFEKPAASTKKELKNINLEVCADMDYKATEFCTKTTSRYFKPGSEPTQPCPVHQGVKVPDVIGISATTAMSTLKDAGFKVSRTYQKSGTIYSGVVISQYPQDGEVKRGTSIKLVISEGASKPKKVAVPNVIGLSETKARNTLRASGFSVSVQYSKNASESGTVIGQSPSRGVQRTRGTKILIIVATS
ncbi:MAG: PASTA domain-containing protein, partial [Terriglobia bacterium]